MDKFGYYLEGADAKRVGKPGLTGDLVLMCLACGQQRSIPCNQLKNSIYIGYSPVLKNEKGFWVSERVVNHRCWEPSSLRGHKDPCVFPYESDAMMVEEFLGDELSLTGECGIDLPNLPVVTMFLEWRCAFLDLNRIKIPVPVDPHNLNTFPAGRAILAKLNPSEWRITDRLDARIWEFHCLGCGYLWDATYDMFCREDFSESERNDLIKMLDHECDAVRLERERANFEKIKRRAFSELRGRKIAIKKVKE